MIGSEKRCTSIEIYHTCKCMMENMEEVTALTFLYMSILSPWFGVIFANNDVSYLDFGVTAARKLVIMRGSSTSSSIAKVAVDIVIFGYVGWLEEWQLWGEKVRCEMLSIVLSTAVKELMFSTSYHLGNKFFVVMTQSLFYDDAALFTTHRTRSPEHSRESGLLVLIYVWKL